MRSHVCDFTMTEIYALVAGTLYGLLIGIIPSAGATTGLVALFGFISYFVNDPYLGVIFCMAVVAASTTGDTYTGVLLGIPGANSAAATMVDGFPLAQQGRATYAITAAVNNEIGLNRSMDCIVQRYAIPIRLLSHIIFLNRLRAS